MIINVSEPKEKLSNLIDMFYFGEKVIIAKKNNLPLVKLVAHDLQAKRKLGLLAEQIRIIDDPRAENDEN